MQIDWVTVVAQIANFLILVWLLQRFLYGPITRAMARREQGIKERMDQAAQQRNVADEEIRAYHEKQEALDRRRDQLLAEAREAAEEERKALEREARETVERRRRDWMSQLEEQRDAFLRELRHRSTERFYALARRALTDLGGVELEEQLALGFVRELQRLDQQTTEKIVRACADAGHTVAIRSRFDLSTPVKRRLTEAVHQRLGEEAQVEYETEPGASCGIALKAGSQTVAWSIDSYLEDFAKAVEEDLSHVARHAQQGAGS